MKKLARSVLVTGSSRGIGLELTRRLAPLTDVLIAACRSPDQALELWSIAAEYKNVQVVQLDILQHESFKDFADQVSRLVGDKGLSLLINNAGINKRLTLHHVSVEEMVDVYSVNTIGPLMLTRALLPLLNMASSNPSDSQSYAVDKAAVVNMSSELGSLTGCVEGLFAIGIYAYQCSKAALNMVTRLLCADLKPYGITVVSVHPGWVKTDMGGAEAPLENERVYCRHDFGSAGACTRAERSVYWIRWRDLSMVITHGPFTKRAKSNCL